MAKRRLILALLGALVATPLLAACSTEPEENQNPQVDTVYVDRGKAMRCVGTTLMLWDRDPWDGGVKATTFVRENVLCGGTKQA